MKILMTKEQGNNNKKRTFEPVKPPDLEKESTPKKQKQGYKKPDTQENEKKKQTFETQNRTDKTTEKLGRFRDEDAERQTYSDKQNDKADRTKQHHRDKEDYRQKRDNDRKKEDKRDCSQDSRREVTPERRVIERDTYMQSTKNHQKKYHDYELTSEIPDEDRFSTDTETRENRRERTTRTETTDSEDEKSIDTRRERSASTSSSETDRDNTSSSSSEDEITEETVRRAQETIKKLNADKIHNLQGRLDSTSDELTKTRRLLEIEKQKLAKMCGKRDSIKKELHTTREELKTTKTYLEREKNLTKELWSRNQKEQALRDEFGHFIGNHASFQQVEENSPMCTSKCMQEVEILKKKLKDATNESMAKKKHDFNEIISKSKEILKKSSKHTNQDKENLSKLINYIQDLTKQLTVLEASMTADINEVTNVPNLIKMSNYWMQIRVNMADDMNKTFAEKLNKIVHHINNNDKHASTDLKNVMADINTRLEWHNSYHMKFLWQLVLSTYASFDNARNACHTIRCKHLTKTFPDQEKQIATELKRCIKDQVLDLQGFLAEVDINSFEEFLGQRHKTYNRILMDIEISEGEYNLELLRQRQPPFPEIVNIKDEPSTHEDQVHKTTTSGAIKKPG